MATTSRFSTTLLRSKLLQWERLWPASVWAATAIYILILTALSIHRFSLLGDCYDISVFEQSYWSTVNEGLPLYNSQEGPRLARVSHFAAHFSPFLFLWTPFYWLWQRPEALLLAKTVALGLGALPLYRLATTLLGSREGGGVVVLIYLLYPPLHGVNLWGFHENEFAVAPLMLLLLCYVRRSWVPFWISLFAALGVKENIALLLAAFGLYLLLFRREKMLGLAVTGVSVSWLFVAQWIIIPLAQGNALFELDDMHFVVRYGPTVGQSYEAIFWNLVQHPLRMAEYAFATPEKRTYLFELLFPLAFIPLAAPETLLISAPVFAQNLLSRYLGQFSILGQYHAEIVPFLFYGLCLGIARIEMFRRWLSGEAGGKLIASGSRVQKGMRQRAVTMTLALVIGTVLIANFMSRVWSFAVGRSDFLLAIAKSPERRKVARELMASIPKDASVMADVSMMPHLGGRVWLRRISREAFVARDWDYVLFDLRFPWVTDISSDEVIGGLQGRQYRMSIVEDIVLFKRPGAA